jgi:hypothetical protein
MSDAHDSISGAVIGALGAIVAALLPLASDGWKRIREHRRYRPISKNTATDLTGHWIGYTQVRDDREVRRYRATIIMRPHKRTVSGTMTVTVETREADENNKGWTLDFVGGFIKEGYLQLDYWHPNPEIRQFGSIIYELKTSRLFEGRFVAMGRDLGRMIYGDARLEKQ